MKAVLDIVDALRFKLRIIGVTIDGSSNLLWNNKSIYRNNTTPDYLLNKKSHYIAYHSFSDSVAYNTIMFYN